MKKFAVYVYVEGWEQKPFSRAFEASCLAEAIEKCAKGLARDEHLCSDKDGNVWWKIVDESNEFDECPCCRMMRELKNREEILKSREKELSEKRELELNALINEIFDDGLKDLSESFDLLRQASKNLKNFDKR